MDLREILSAVLPAERILTDEPMSAHTTFRAGGCADAFVTVQSEEELTRLLAAARAKYLPCVIVGRGSNLLVRDGGIRGLVICLEGMNELTLTEDGTGIRAGSGTSLAALAAFARDHALKGLAFAGGIPGTVGGGLVMNAGAFGGELKDVTESVRVMDGDGSVRVLSGEEMAFGYRDSIVKRRGGIITGAEFRLEKGDRDEIAAAMEELAEKRREKQPLNYPSAGSTWKRPEGYFAAKLIDEVGCRGMRVGDAQISEKHAGFLVNLGHATASDIQALMRQVEKRVLEHSGVQLTPEVVILGEDL